MNDLGCGVDEVPPPPAEPRRHWLPRRRRRALFLLASLVVAIIAIRASLVCVFADSLPFWDEWDALVGFQMHKALLGTLSIRDLFEPHVDHPIAMTRALIALLFWLNDYQFDNLPVALLNAPLYASAWAIPTWHFATHPIARMRWFALLFGLAGLAPIDSENILTGFQSAFYFLVGSAMVTLWIAASTRGASRRSIVGFGLVATLGCFTLASGFAAATVAAVICALRALRETELRRPLLVRSAIGVGLTGFGVWLHTFSLGSRIPHPFAWHDALDALSCLAWPYAGNATIGLLVSMPFAAFALRLLRGERAVAPDWFVFGIGVWVAMHAATFAVGREVNGTLLPSRYLLILSFWPLLNIYCVARLIGGWTGALGGWYARIFAALPAIAAGTLLAFLAGHLPDEVRQLQTRGTAFAQQTQRVASFLRSGDASALDGVGLQIPYPDPKRLKLLLNDPVVQNMMPWTVRTPAVVFPLANIFQTPFSLNGIPPELPRLEGISAEGSFGRQGAATTGRFRSALIPGGDRYLVFYAAGDLGKPGLSLQLACDTGCTTRDVLPADTSPGWHKVFVATPRTSFRIVAQDSSSDAWFAFSAPIEAGTLGVASRALFDAMRWHAPGAIALLIMTIALLLWPVWRQRHCPEVDDPPELPAPAAARASTGPQRADSADADSGGALTEKRARRNELAPRSLAKAIAWYRDHPRARTVAAITAIAALTLVAMILRRPDQWSAPYVWVEDGVTMLPDFIANGWRSVLHTAAGYYLLPTKLILAFSGTLSFRRLPEVEYWLTLVFTGAVLAAFAFSPTQLRWRAACALSLLLLPIDSEVYAVSAYAFWWGSLLAVLPLLWRSDGPKHLLLRTVYLLVGGLSSPLIIVLTPLYAIRAAWQRDRMAYYELVLAVTVAAFQAVPLAQSGQGLGNAVGALNPALFVRKFFGYFVYVPAQEVGHVGATLFAGSLLLALLLVFSVRRRADLGRAYFLLVGAFLAAAFASSIRIPLADLHPAGSPRYYFAPFAFLSMAIVQLASLRDRYAQLVAVAIAALAIRNALDIGQRHHDHLDWRANVEACTASREYEMPIHFDGHATVAWKVMLTGADCRMMIDRSWFDARIVARKAQ